MTQRTALTKTLRDGRTAVVTIKPVDHLHQPSTTLYIEGKEITRHLGAHHAAPKAALAKAGPEYVAAIGPMLLTADEAAQIEQVYREVSAAIPPDLDGERERLVTALDYAEQGSGINAAERFDKDYANPFGGPEADEDQQRIIEAAEALAAFDAAHPETARKAAAQREATVRRIIEGGH
jgi:hypothetical protein